jgi:hypothetical protein
MKEDPTSYKNICLFITKDNHDLFYPVHEKSSFQFDPNQFCGSSPESIQRIKAHIVHACRKSGFYLRVDCSGNRMIGNQKYFVSFKCDHNKNPHRDVAPVYDGKHQKPGTKVQPEHDSKKVKGTKPQYRRINTSRPESESHRCPFRLRIFCSSSDNFWYLSWLNQLDDEYDLSMHRGHIRLPSDHIRVPLYEFTDDDKQLIQHCKQLMASNSMMAQLVGKYHDSNLMKPSQVRYLLQRAEAEKVLSDCAKSMSSAEIIIQQFDELTAQDSGTNYVALVHSSTYGYKIRVPKGRPTKTCGTLTDLDVEAIRKSLSLHDGQDILLAFAWVTSHEAQMAYKFPELFVMDVTEKTNVEKRGLFVVTGVDGNNKIFVALHCFMPNGLLESYDWIYDYAFPLLLGDTTISNNEVTITDGEVALYAPLVNLTQTASPWQGTKHLLCEYHLVEQYWCSKVMPLAR